MVPRIRGIEGHTGSSAPSGCRILEIEAKNRFKIRIITYQHNEAGDPACLSIFRIRRRICSDPMTIQVGVFQKFRIRISKTRYYDKILFFQKCQKNPLSNHVGSVAVVFAGILKQKSVSNHEYNAGSGSRRKIRRKI